MAKHRKQSDRTKRLGTGALVAASATGALLGLNGTANASDLSGNNVPSADDVAGKIKFAADDAKFKAKHGKLVASKYAIDDAKDRVRAGKSVRIAGTLKTTWDHDLSNKLVYLQRHSSSGWHNIASTRTNAKGRAGFTTKVKSTKSYRLAYKGDYITSGSRSAAQKVTAYTPRPTAASSSSVAAKIVQAAAAQAGDPYSYGATGPDSFDCSGLTQYAHRLAGISIPRTSSEQYAASKKISKADKKPGDLIAFYDGGGVYHVGIYAGNGQIWHAPEQGDVVRKADIWTSSYEVGRFW